MSDQNVKYQQIKTDSFKMIPVVPLESSKSKQMEEKNNYKLIINELSHMNKSYLDRGAGKKVVVNGQKVYRDVPNFSLKLWQKEGKIHQHIQVPKDTELKQQLCVTLQANIKNCRYVQNQLKFVNPQDLHVFAITGHCIISGKTYAKTSPHTDRCYNGKIKITQQEESMHLENMVVKQVRLLGITLRHY